MEKYKNVTRVEVAATTVATKMSKHSIFMPNKINIESGTPKLRGEVSGGRLVAPTFEILARPKYPRGAPKTHISHSIR